MEGKENTTWPMKRERLNETEAKGIFCTTALHKIEKKFPYPWDLNIYRGCSHRCQYCFAQYTHAYIGRQDYFGEIYWKENIAELLEKELRSPSWKQEVINLGGVTDSYQPAEKYCRIMPDILKVMIRYKNPVVISTKSDLILRDYDLFDQLSRVAHVNIAVTVTTMEERIREKIEPEAAPSWKRLEVLKTFRQTKASTGLHMMPLIPYLTDTEENLRSVLEAGRSCQADYVILSLLNLKGKTKSNFFQFLERTYPELFPKIGTLYRGAYPPKAYADSFFQLAHRLQKEYHFSHDWKSFAGPKDNNGPVQLKLF